MSFSHAVCSHMRESFRDAWHGVNGEASEYGDGELGTGRLERLHSTLSTISVVSGERSWPSAKLAPSEHD